MTAAVETCPACGGSYRAGKPHTCRPSRPVTGLTVRVEDHPDPAGWEARARRAETQLAHVQAVARLAYLRGEVTTRAWARLLRLLPPAAGTAAGLWPAPGLTRVSPTVRSKGA